MFAARRNKIRRIVMAMAGTWLMIGMLILSISFKAHSNVISNEFLTGIYQKSFFKDISYTTDRSYKKWAPKYTPAPFPGKSDQSQQEPRAKQYIDKSSRKGLTAKSPEPGFPVYSGVFYGYPYLFNCWSKHYRFIVILFADRSSFRVRPPPSA